MATTRVAINLPQALPHYNRENEEQTRVAIEKAIRQCISGVENVGVGLVDIADYGAAGGYIRSTGSAWARVTGLAAADLTGTVASARISGSYTGITGVGTITAGTWNGSSISTTYTDAKVVSVSGTSNRITSTGGGTPVIDISASYVGQSSITTLGTITTGVWTGTQIADAYLAALAASKLTGTTLPSGIVTSSLTALGTVVTGVWHAGEVTATGLAGVISSRIKATDCASDEKLWDFIVSATTLNGRTINDADTDARSWIQVTRIAYSPSQVLFPIGLSVPNGKTATFLDAADANGFLVGVVSTSNDAFVKQVNNSPLTFYTNNTSRLVISAAGVATFSENVDLASGKVYKVNGTQVVTAQQTGIGASLSSRTAGATYGGTEQTMLQEAHDKARLMEAALKVHGLLAT